MKDRQLRAKKALRQKRKRIDARKNAWLHAAMAKQDLLRCYGEPLSLRADNAVGSIPSFDGVAYSGGLMTPNLAIAWRGPVVVDLAGLISESVIPVHRDHDETRPVAHTTSVVNDGSRLVCSGAFSIDSKDAQEVLSGARNGFPWRPSVGLKMIKTVTLAAGQRATVNGREFLGPLLVVRESILKELSVVTIPGDGDSDLTISASQGSESMLFEDYVKSLGLDPATLTPEATAALQCAFDESQETAPDVAAAAPAPSAEASDASDKPAPAEDPAKATASGSRSVDLTATTADIARITRETMASETLRANSVRDLCARFSNPTILVNGKPVDLAAHAIQHGWKADQVELHARRHSDLEAARDRRPSGPAIHSVNRSERNSLQALQAGMLLRAGCALDSPAFNHARVRARLPGWLQAGVNDPARQRAMDAGHAHSELSLVDACRMALQANGHDVPSNRNDMLHASFSTGSTSALFGATIGARMLLSYAEIQDFSEGWCQEEENPDLEQHNRNQTEAAQNLAYHPVGGEAAHTGLTVTTEKAQVQRFTRQMEIDEADFLSDNFGKFKDTPKMFGLAAGRVRPNLVAAVIMGNPTLLKTGRALFNTTDGNAATGAALARATLSAAIARIARRMDGDASINLNSTHLLVPPELMDTAVQLTKSGLLSNDSGSGELNPLKQYNITPVMEPRLANGLTHPVTGVAIAGSTVTYYLVSKEANTIEVTYLTGAGRVPVVRTTDLVNGKFGLNVDVRHYVGAAPMDWRGFDRSIG